MFNGYGIAFDCVALWSICHVLARCVVSFAADNSSSFHADNCKDNFSVLDEGPTCDINGSFGAPDKKFSINFTEVKRKCCFSLHYNCDKIYL